MVKCAKFVHKSKYLAQYKTQILNNTWIAKVKMSSNMWPKVTKREPI